MFDYTCVALFCYLPDDEDGGTVVEEAGEVDVDVDTEMKVAVVRLFKSFFRILFSDLFFVRLQATENRPTWCGRWWNNGRRSCIS